MEKKLYALNFVTEWRILGHLTPSFRDEAIGS